MGAPDQRPMGVVIGLALVLLATPLILSALLGGSPPSPPPPPPPPEPPPPEPIPAPREDVPEVKVGQRYVLTGHAGELELRQTFEVIQVDAHAVRYRLHVEVGPPGAAGPFPGASTEYDFSLVPPATPALGPDEPVTIKEDREELYLCGRMWDCLIVDDAVVGRSWVPQRSGEPIFPPFVRAAGPTMELQLSEIR